MNHKKLFTLSICIFVLNLCINAQPISKLTYKEFLECKDAQTHAQNLKDQNEYGKAIKLYKFLTKSIEHAPSAYINLAICHWALEDKDSTWLYLTQAFKWGYDKWYLKYQPEIQECFADSIQKYYDNYAYLNVDTTIRMQLSKLQKVDQHNRRLLRGASPKEKDSLWVLQRPIDSANAIAFKKMVKQYGWPGSKLIGKPPLQQRPIAHVLVAHMNEADKLFFQDIAIKAALNNETSWSDAEMINQQLLFKHPEFGFIKLRHLFLSEDQQIDEDRSLLQLNAIVKLFTTNNHSNLELFTTKYIDQPAIKNHLELLEEIKSKLIYLGLPEERISLAWDPLLVPHDPLGDYLFGFKRFPNPNR